MTDENVSQKVIGLLPAGGRATRIAPLPCSKELYPVGFRFIDAGQSIRPKVVCHYLLENMRSAGITRAYIILRKGKWDIPAYLGDGDLFDMHLAYLMMRRPFGVPYTLDQAYPFIHDAHIAFGFPDIIFQPEDAFHRLLAKQASTQSDVVLGLWPTKRTHQVDMVDIDTHGRVRQIVIQPSMSHLTFTWVIAVWSPVFTRFMHDYLKHFETTRSREQLASSVEMSMGSMIQRAIEGGLVIESVLFPNPTFVDIGTPEDLAETVRNLILPSESFGETL